MEKFLLGVLELSLPLMLLLVLILFIILFIITLFDAEELKEFLEDLPNKLTYLHLRICKHSYEKDKLKFAKFLIRHKKENNLCNLQCCYQDILILDRITEYVELCGYSTKDTLECLNDLEDLKNIIANIILSKPISHKDDDQYIKSYAIILSMIQLKYLNPKYNYTFNNKTKNTKTILETEKNLSKILETMVPSNIEESIKNAFLDAKTLTLSQPCIKK